jgi:Sulfotransferase domain
MLPNLIVIGAAKSGTTSLHYYLSLHPQIRMSLIKELDFFVRELNWDKGIKWYESNFKGEAKIFGESSPRYTFVPRYDGVPERMYGVVPEARLIYLLRDPVERIISHYTFLCNLDEEKRSFQDAVKEDDRYLPASRYCMQLEHYLKYYNLSNILIITSEELYEHRLRTIQKIFRFLNVDDSFCTSRFSALKLITKQHRKKNKAGLLLESLNRLSMVNRIHLALGETVGRYIYIPFSRKIPPPVSSEIERQQLIDELQDDVNRLRRLTGQSFEQWCL